MTDRSRRFGTPSAGHAPATPAGRARLPRRRRGDTGRGALAADRLVIAARCGRDRRSIPAQEHRIRRRPYTLPAKPPRCRQLPVAGPPAAGVTARPYPGARCPRAVKQRNWHETDPRSGAGTARLFHPHPGAAGGDRSGADRRRPAGLGADRIGQDRRLRTGHRPHPAGRGRQFRHRRNPAGADHRPHPRTGIAGAPRTGLALCRCRRGGHLLRRRHGHARRTPGAGPRRPYRRRHPRPAARPYHARLDRAWRHSRGGAGRGRRDARPRFPRGSGVHPRRSPRQPPDADVLGHRAAGHRHAGPKLSARCRPRRHQGRNHAACRYRISRADGFGQ